MKFVTFSRHAESRPGLWLESNGILDLTEAAARADARLDASSLLAIIRGGEPALAAVRSLAASAAKFAAATHPLAEVTLEAPIPHPVRNVFCVGRNYVDHVAEGARALNLASELPTVPQFFTKATHAVIGPGADVRFDPKVSAKMDYEVELGVVIGKTGRDIGQRTRRSITSSATPSSTMSRRAICSAAHGQWFKGKSLDTTLPHGALHRHARRNRRSDGAGAFHHHQRRRTPTRPR